MTFVGAAPALLELVDGEAGLEVCVVVMTCEVVVALVVVVIIVPLECEVVEADVLAGAVAVAVEVVMVVRPASTSSEASSGIMVAAVIAMPRTQDCASGARVLNHAGKPLSRIWLWSISTAEGFPMTPVSVAGTPPSLRY
jgi:hypothetical protein